MTRRAMLASMAAALGRAAARLPANRNVKWGLGSNLWNYFPGSTFTEMVANARAAMEFLKELGAKHLVVFSPNRNAGKAEGAFESMCQSFNEIGRAAGEMGFRAGLHNHIGQMVQTPDELDRCMRLTDPKLFWLSPDTAHLHLAGFGVAKTLARYQDRLMLADYKDAKRPAGQGDRFDRNTIFDLGGGEIDFPACHRVLKSAGYQGWLIVDLDIARQGPLASYQRCGSYVVDTLEPIYV